MGKLLADWQIFWRKDGHLATELDVRGWGAEPGTSSTTAHETVRDSTSGVMSLLDTRPRPGNPGDT